MKRILSTICSLSLISALVTGCGSTPSAPSQSASPSGTPAQVTVNYYGRPDDKGVESTIVARFEAQNPDVKINYVKLPDSSNDRLKTISTVLQAKDSSIDVFAGDVVWPSIFVSAGWVMPLDSYLQAGDLDGYLTGPLSAFQMNGATYGLPFMADSGALYYRTDLLEKYGKKPPATWEEMTTIAAEIMAGEKNPALRGYASYWKQAESLTCIALEIYWAKGGRIVDDSGKSAVDEQIMKDTMAYMQALKGMPQMTADGIETFDTAGSRKEVTGGNAIFTRDWLSGYAPFNDAEGSSVAGKIEIAPVPGGYATLGGWGVMVSEFSKNKDAAVRFAKFRASYESQLAANEITRIVPTIKAMYEDKSVLELTPHLPKFIPILEKARPRPQSPYYAELSGIMQLELHSVITGLTTPEQGAAGVKQKIDSLLS